MKMIKKLSLMLVILMIGVFALSCASTGEYMPLKEGETIIGTVQTTFLVQSTFFGMSSVKRKVNTQVYVMLMEAAGKKYSESIDLRDIVWITGNTINNTRTEIFATAKVIQKK